MTRRQYAVAAVHAMVVLFSCCLWQAPASFGAGQENESKSSVAKQEQRLQDARDLVERQHYRKAGQLLLDQLQAINDRAPSSTLSCSLMAALGEVYLRSGRYELACTWLQKAHRAYNSVTPKSRKLLADQCAAALLLAEAYEQLGEVKQAIAALEQMAACYDRADVTDPVSQMELYSRRLPLGQGIDPPELRKSLQEKASQLARRLTIDRRKGLVSNADFTQGLFSLAEYQVRTKQWKAAAETIRTAIRIHAARNEDFEELAAWKRLAEIDRLQANSAAEIDTLQQAIQRVAAFEQTKRDSDRDAAVRRLYERAELQRLLSTALIRNSQPAEAIDRLTHAINDYASALKIPQQRADGGDSGVSELVLLERLAEAADQLLPLTPVPSSAQLKTAIQAHANLLVQYKNLFWTDDPRIGHLWVILAGLYLKDGDPQSADPLLHDALTFWRRQKPVNHLRLAQSLSMLADAALQTEQIASAKEIEGYLAEARTICLEHLPQHELRWQTHLNLGRLYLMTGRYQQALVLLKELTSATRPSLPSNAVRSAALLELGLLHKGLMRFSEASEFCKQALELRQQEVGSEHPELASFLLALGSLHIAERNVIALEKVVQQAVAVGAAVANDLRYRRELAHQQAMIHYLSNELTSSAPERRAAGECWQQMLADPHKVSPATRAKILYYLARLDYLDWAADADAWHQQFLQNKAEFSDDLAHFEQALQAHQQQRRQFLNDLERYENGQLSAELKNRKVAYQELIDRRKNLQQKQQKLKASYASALEQEKRLAQSRANVADGWLAQLRHGRSLSEEAANILDQQGTYPSLQYAVMCNAAQLIDAEAKCMSEGADETRRQALGWLEKAVALVENPRANAVGDELLRAEFFVQYRAAFDLLVQFHVEAYEHLKDPDNLVQALVAAERCRSRALLDQLRLAEVKEQAAESIKSNVSNAEYLAGLVRHWQKEKQPLLYYYVGASQSYLFVLGGSESRFQVVRLRAPAGEETAGQNTGVTSAQIDFHVARLRACVSNAQEADALANSRTLRNRLAISSDVLMPAEVRDYLRHEKEQHTSHAVVVPHGAIACLPLEALVLEQTNTFLEDVSPPLTYAPSLALLDMLYRVPTPNVTDPTVLTLGNPAYTSGENGSLASTTAERSSLTSLTRLPESQQECDRIEALFGKQAVTKLTSERATEGQMRAAIHARPSLFLHLAAHGMLLNNDLSPWIALAPPQATGSKSDDDGKLELREIHQLNLVGCELTVLSTCNANLDPRYTARLDKVLTNRPQKTRVVSAAVALDTNFSLANAFLAAGCRRVIATEWPVADRSTAQFVSTFFEKLDTEIAAKRPLHYAQLAAETRQELRRHPEWSSPFFWAPFVLIGPAVSP